MISQVTTTPLMAGVLRRPRVGFGKLDPDTVQTFVRPRPDTDADTFEPTWSQTQQESRDRLETSQNHLISKTLKSDKWDESDIQTPLQKLIKRGLKLNITTYDALVANTYTFSPETTRLILLCNHDDQS